MTFDPRDADPLTIEPDADDLTAKPEYASRLYVLRSQRRSAIPRGCLWWSTWLVVGAGIWAAGILIVASVVATPRGADQSANGGSDPFATPFRPVVDRFLGAPQVAGAPNASSEGPWSAPSDRLDGGAPPLAAEYPPAISSGVASWFAARGYQGAVPWWRAGQDPVWATLSRFADGRTYSVTLLITGFCQCLAGQPGERLIDLSPAAFRALGAPLSVGLIEVTMQVPVQGPRLPATDQEGP